MTCLQREPSRRSKIKLAMLARIHTVLTLGAAHGHTSIVLGAWGCGAFGNDGAEMAAWFDRVLQTDLRGVYNHILSKCSRWIVKSSGFGNPL